MKSICKYLSIAAAWAVIGFATPAQAQPAPDANSVLVLAAANGYEASKAAALGYTVVMASDVDWQARTTAEFATFKALILGDPICGWNYWTTSPWLTAAEANRSVWSPAVTGNVIIVGTDPSYHWWAGEQLTGDGIGFAAAEPGKTGLYATLSCYYDSTPPNTPVPVLDQFGSFTVRGTDCVGPVHIVASHPALAGVTDASLSNWYCSTHEAFDSFPSSFLPLAIASNIGCEPGGTGITFGDGSCGTPYIMARGKELVPAACGDGNIDVGETCDDGNTANGDGCSAQCQIEEPTGPVCGDGVIDAGEQCDDGNAVDGDGCSSVCTIENEAPSCSAATVSSPMLWPPNHTLVPVSISVSDPDGDTVTVTATSITQDEVVTGGGVGSGNTSADASLAPLAVRAERNGNPKSPGNGRVYHIAFTADDGNGGSCTGAVTVCVPHDQRPGASCVDGGPLYSSIP